MTKNEDIVLIERVLKGDVSAFELIVRKYQSYVFTMALKIIGNNEDAEEVAMDVFLKVYKSLKDFKNESNFSTWLYKIAYNSSLNKLQKNKKILVSVNSENINITDRDNFDDENIVFYIEIALKKLNETERTIVHLYYYDDFSVKEISEITGNSVENVKIILYRCRKKLYDFLKDKIDENKLIAHES